MERLRLRIKRLRLGLGRGRKRKPKKVIKPKKITKAKLAKKARTAARKSLAAWSLAVRKKGKCDICKAKKNLQAHHLLPRERYKTLRIEIMNGVCLCPTCHKWGRKSAHRNSVFFSEWLRKERPEQFAWVISHMNCE